MSPNVLIAQKQCREITRRYFEPKYFHCLSSRTRWSFVYYWDRRKKKWKEPCFFQMILSFQITSIAQLLYNFNTGRLLTFSRRRSISYRNHYICSANQWAGFYLIETSAMKELTQFLRHRKVLQPRFPLGHRTKIKRT